MGDTKGQGDILYFVRVLYASFMMLFSCDLIYVRLHFIHGARDFASTFTVGFPPRLQRALVCYVRVLQYFIYHSGVFWIIYMFRGYLGIRLAPRLHLGWV